MKISIRNALALILGLIFGSAVNMGLIVFGPTIIPPPEGVDVSSVESLKSSMHLFEARHFIMPFLAHALGTFVAALVVSLVAVSHQDKFAFGVGGLFLLGGISNAFMLPAPTWFIVVDLVAAYLPMAWFGYFLVSRLFFGEPEEDSAET